MFYRADGSSLVVERSRVHRGAVNLKFKGYDDIDSAMTLIGTVLHIDKDAVSLPEGTYFIQDLLGMRVLDSDTGECYGVIVQVQPTGANDVYHIKAPDEQAAAGARHPAGGAGGRRGLQDHENHADGGAV